MVAPIGSKGIARMPTGLASLDRFLRTFAFGILLCLGASPGYSEERWRGLVVAPENRCAPYERERDYPYSQSAEARIVASMGGRIYGPYTGRSFTSTRETDIEHIVATSEAHDSGLCAASAATRASFASDPLNLTLAAPEVNRCGRGGKCGLDAAEWLPSMNRCWFAERVVQVRRKYGLTVDRREADTLERILSGCENTDMVMISSSMSDRPGEPLPNLPQGEVDALRMWDDNRNGRITCAEARNHGIAPVTRGHPAYPYMKDGDGDGTVCE